MKNNRQTRLVAAVAVGTALLLVGCTAVAPSKQATSQGVIKSAHPRSLKTQKKEEPKSWFGSWFQPKEPEKPKNVPDWMDKTKRPEL